MQKQDAKSLTGIKDMKKNTHEIKSNKKDSYMWLRLLLSFLLPAGILLVSFARYGMAPFGDKCINIMDMSGQYVEFFCGLKNITSYKDIFFSWGKVLGSNYTGVFAYYVASPLSFLTLLCPNEYMPVGLLFLTVLKIGLCGLTMCIFLNRRHHGAPNIFFSACYGLISYNIVYSMCLMWLDGVIWLPIVLLGVDKIIEDRDMKLFTFSLAMVFISNYYISFAVGLFAFLFYLMRLLENRGNLSKFTDGLLTFARFAGGTALAAGAGAWLLLPTYYSLKEGKIDGFSYKFTTDTNFSFEEIVPKLLCGEYDSITNSGTPFIYAGCAVLILAVAYFFVKGGRIRLVEKLSSFVLLLVLVLSLISTSLDLAWHVFQTPNWFPYRWSFVLSFFVIYLASEAFYAMKGITPAFWCGIASGTVLFSAACIRKYGKGTETFEFAGIFLFILALYCFLSKLQYFTGNMKARKIMRLSVICIMAAVFAWEMSYHQKGLIEGLDRAHGYELYDNYVEYKKTMNDVLEVTKNESTKDGLTGYAAVGHNFSRSYNESIGFGVRGMAHYSSAYDRNTNSFLGYLGYSQGFLWNLEFGSTPVTDTLFGVRYLLNNKNIEEWDTEYKIETGSITTQDSYELIGVVGGAGITEIYKNPYSITAPFVCSGDIVNFSWKNNCFASQNGLLSCAAGSQTEAFAVLPAENIEISYEAGVIASGNRQTYTGHDKVVTYTVMMPSDGALYGYFGKNSNDECRLFVNGGGGLTLFRGETNCIQCLGSYKKGECVSLEILIKGTTLYTRDFLFYVLDTELLKTTANELAKSAMNIDKFDTGYIRGTVSSEGGYLFTSIPYNEGWAVKIDGEKAETCALSDALLLCKMPEGTHEVELSYTAKGLKTGALISLVSVSLSAVLLLVSAIVHKVRKNHREESEEGSSAEAVSTGDTAASIL